MNHEKFLPKKEEKKKLKEEKIKKEEKRERILKAAGQLFIQNGYANTRIIDIAKAADVAKGTVYEYFSSKDALVVEWIKKVGIETNEITVQAIAEGNAEEKLEKFIQVKIETFVLMAPLIKLFVERGHEATSDEKVSVMKALITLIENESNTIKRIIRAGIAECRFRKDLDIEAATALILSNVIMFSLYSNRTKGFVGEICKAPGMCDEITPSQDTAASCADKCDDERKSIFEERTVVKVEALLDIIINGLKG